MEILRRGLTKEFVKALSDAYKGGGWWKSIVEDRELFVTPRQTCVCVYYRGNRLLKVWLDAGERLAGEVHYKYLLNPDVKPKYRSVRDGEVDLPEIAAFIPNFSNLDVLKRASKLYARVEKSGVSEIIAANANILDVEVAFGHSDDPDEEDANLAGEMVAGKSHHYPRIDFVAVQKDGTGLKLVFFEAKHFTNPELTSGSGNPRVVDQISKYEKLLEKNKNKDKEDIVDAYRRHCADMLDSDSVPKNSERYFYLSKILDAKSIRLDTEPRLIVFGFDADRKRGAAWKLLKQTLEEYFGKDRVFLRGHANGLVLGVRFQEP
jgi:hypothetical protein